MGSETLARLYGFSPGAEFSQHFGKASIESLLLYIVAYSAHVVEVLMDTTRQEIEEMLVRQVPGRLSWYAQKLKDFMLGYQLNDIGEYTLPDDIEQSEITKAQVVRHAVALEDTTTGILILKVAGDDGSGNRKPLSDTQQRALEEYIMRIKYAGVRTQLVNAPGDTYSATIEIWYDPLLLATDVRDRCLKAIGQYLGNLPFNGQYSNMALIDQLQQVEGVKVAELVSASYQEHGKNTTNPIAAIATPYAGYFTMGSVTINTHEYE